MLISFNVYLICIISNLSINALIPNHKESKFSNFYNRNKNESNLFKGLRTKLALLPFECGYFNFFKKDKSNGFNVFKWASDNSKSEKDEKLGLVETPKNVEEFQDVSVYQKILEGTSSKLFVLNDTFGGNSNVNVKIGKEQANKLNLMTGDFVKVRGRRRKVTVCGVDVTESITKNEVSFHEDLRRNLRLRLGDIVFMDKINTIPEAKIVHILPFKDTIEPLIKQLSIYNTENDVRKVIKNILYEYFSNEVSNGNSRPVRVGDHFTLCVRVNGPSSVSLTDQCDYLKLEFKILQIKAFSKKFGDVLVDSDVGLIVGESVIDSGGNYLSREDDDSFGEVGYDDIGGMNKQLSKIRELIELPLLHPELFKTVGINPPKVSYLAPPGVTLLVSYIPLRGYRLSKHRNGNIGSGKTLVARAIANETGAKCYVINGPEIMSKMVGESEEKLRKTFETASKNAPSIIFIDEIDSIAGKRDKTSGELERRLVSQLLTLMDVLAATNRINSIDNALRRFGRFDREIEMVSCDEKERYEILKVKTKNMRLADDVDLHKIAKECHGFVGADIAQLCFEAAMTCIKESINSPALHQYYYAEEIPQDVLSKLLVRNKHFMEALSLCNPSNLREKIVEIPETTWNDIGGLETVKNELIETIQYPLQFPEKFIKYGQSSNKGVLFYGPPGPELLTMWFGESEANVRELFDKARASAPCILFFDEIDSIAKTRSSNTSTGSEAADRVINQILTEIDGINVKKPIFIIAATNRPDIIDPAILRPGRLGKLIYIPLPDLKSRENIFKASLKNSPLSPDVNISKMAQQLEGYSGADIAEICHRAAREAIRESIEAEIKRKRPLEKGEKDPVPYITNKHFQIALKNSRYPITGSGPRPSTSPEKGFLTPKGDTSSLVTYIIVILG
ncbi:cell divison cycle CDC48 homologue or transitional endoplasmic reticulum ATPase [Theileria annulata]|uniref:Cell divison cycle CDC48 homologue, putative or transitional endoplasmic reticulum ATPase, putative n=1 Tax=Theileria annulata TaxID=5874 RepID=Q4UBT9_THEAN|nr:cell divison cycle CDC48 homologue or transitional endoplasmic reticulum ATPase [Theileria annulata]CAI75712.1 cell divison cycle CDC48 homologue, putative or transitional endoplasmic reticulum ATPase, putative [Theileria annulata]|eukprot:XP_955188.1 cell divison cycle CDC48 homologue, putative or transitional endoplasmic reticulum ATPase, putative [Theileria annulata]